MAGKATYRLYRKKNTVKKNKRMGKRANTMLLAICSMCSQHKTLKGAMAIQSAMGFGSTFQTLTSGPEVCLARHIQARSICKCLKMSQIKMHKEAQPSYPRLSCPVNCTATAFSASVHQLQKSGTLNRWRLILLPIGCPRM